MFLQRKPKCVFATKMGICYEVIFLKITPLKCSNMQPNQLEDIATTKRLVFPRKKWFKVPRKEFKEEKTDSHLSKKITEFQINFALNQLRQHHILNSTCGGTKIISDCRGVFRQIAKGEGPFQSALIARFFKTFGPRTIE